MNILYFYILQEGWSYNACTWYSVLNSHAMIVVVRHLRITVDIWVTIRRGSYTNRSYSYRIKIIHTTCSDIFPKTLQIQFLKIRAVKLALNNDSCDVLCVRYRYVVVVPGFCFTQLNVLRCVCICMYKTWQR